MKLCVKKGRDNFRKESFPTFIFYLYSEYTDLKPSESIKIDYCCRYSH